MFGVPERTLDLVEQMCLRGELSNPRMTSYKYNIARADFNILWFWMDSPEIDPLAPVDLSDSDDCDLGEPLI
jgi:hypothetical protein